jgi:hypothetical protein
MNDAERDHLLHRMAQLERVNRRWKLLALAGTPLLALLLLVAAANGVACYVMFRDARQREQQARVEAEETLVRAQQALVEAKVAQVQALQAEERARVEAKDAGKGQHEPQP